MNKTDETHLQKSCVLRNDFWAGIGKVDSDLLAPLINPSFMGGPQWPSFRQALITVRRGASTIVASDGLSDPFENPGSEEAKTYNGYGLELYLETSGDLDPVAGSWQAHVVYAISQTAASAQNLQFNVREYQFISSEVFDLNLPEVFKQKFQDDTGRSGILLGLPSGTVPNSATLSLESIDIVNIKLLTVKEFAHIEQYDDEGQNEVAELLIADANTTLSNLDRKSVI